MVYLGHTFRQLRESIGLTQRAAATELGISFVHLSNIENDKAKPSAALLEHVRELWGVDPYVFAWCRHGDVKKLPKRVREAASRLAEAWHDEVERAVAESRRSRAT